MRSSGPPMQRDAFGSRRSGAGPAALVLGAGPAGLACALELSASGLAAAVVDANAEVGGLCRTLAFDGFLFDIGGHRFLSNSAEVNALWRELLGPDLLCLHRRSSICYQGRRFRYPLQFFNVVGELGLWESARCIASYMRSGAPDGCGEDNFEAWMVRRFGRRLFEIFFKTYTEKVWGIPCRELSSDWAKQRVQTLSLAQAIRSSLVPVSGNGAKTLAEHFYYPRLGPGLFCERLRAACERHGAAFQLQSRVEEILWMGHDVTGIVVQGGSGGREVLAADAFFSSIPLTQLIERLRPAAPEEIVQAARALRFRSFIAVNLIFDAERVFDEQWIYIHSPEVRMGRVQNYKNWSSWMVPDARKTSLGVEYFVTQGDDLWRTPDDGLIELALSELERMGIVAPGSFLKGFVVRVANAYPVYGPGYKERVRAIGSFLARFRNLQVMGRAGLFRYNNSDHAVATGLAAARNLLGAGRDLWSMDPGEEPAECVLQDT